MLLTLLLQATPPQGPPYAIYATLAVGILSLIASGLNIYFSSKTAQKVVNLSTKTTREVAELSAQVSRESAGLSAQTARELKEKDYKNDFYKKIIEKRLNAWEGAEEFISLLGNNVVDTSDGKTFPSYYTDSDAFDKVLYLMHSRLSKSFWIGTEYATHIATFHNILAAIRSNCLTPNKVLPKPTAYVAVDTEIDNELLMQAGKDNFRICNELLDKLIKILSSQLSKLHNVDAYLTDLATMGINVPEEVYSKNGNLK